MKASNDTNLGIFYKTDKRTIKGYRDNKPLLYKALVTYFVSEQLKEIKGKEDA